LAHRPDWWEECSKGKNLLNMATDVNSMNVGSMEDFYSNTYNNYINCLQWALDHWKEPEKEFDVLSKKIIISVLKNKLQDRQLFHD